jgi:hypothetical protein
VTRRRKPPLTIGLTQWAMPEAHKLMPRHFRHRGVPPLRIGEPRAYRPNTGVLSKRAESPIGVELKRGVVQAAESLTIDFERIRLDHLAALCDTGFVGYRVILADAEVARRRVVAQPVRGRLGREEVSRVPWRSALPRRHRVEELGCGHL